MQRWNSLGQVSRIVESLVLPKNYDSRTLYYICIYKSEVTNDEICINALSFTSPIPLLLGNKIQIYYTYFQ